MLDQYGDAVEPEAAGSLDAAFRELCAEEQQELGALMRLGGELRQALAPVCPSASFREGLRGSLVKLASERQSREVVIDLRPRPRELVIGAAIGSAVALAGGIAYLIRARTQAQS